LQNRGRGHFQPTPAEEALQVVLTDRFHSGTPGDGPI
jgi:hypothetical protein